MTPLLFDAEGVSPMELLDTRQAAARRGCSTAWIRSLVMFGRLTPVRKVGTAHLFDAADVDALEMPTVDRRRERRTAA